MEKYAGGGGINSVRVMWRGLIHGTSFCSVNIVNKNMSHSTNEIDHVQALPTSCHICIYS